MPPIRGRSTVPDAGGEVELDFLDSDENCFSSLPNRIFLACAAARRLSIGVADLRRQRAR